LRGWRWIAVHWLMWELFCVTRFTNKLGYIFVHPYESSLRHCLIILWNNIRPTDSQVIVPSFSPAVHC
jgi:hypothetical protein